MTMPTQEDSINFGTPYGFSVCTNKEPVWRPRITHACRKQSGDHMLPNTKYLPSTRAGALLAWTNTFESGNYNRLTDRTTLCGQYHYLYEDTYKLTRATRVQVQYTGMTNPMTLRFGLNRDGSRDTLSLSGLTDLCNHTSTFAYNADRTLQQVLLGQGVGSDLQTNYSYTPHGQLARVVNHLTSGGLSSSFTGTAGPNSDVFTTNGRGQRLGVTVSIPNAPIRH